MAGLASASSTERMSSSRWKGFLTKPAVGPVAAVLRRTSSVMPTPSSLTAERAGRRGGGRSDRNELERRHVHAERVERADHQHAARGAGQAAHAVHRHRLQQGRPAIRRHPERWPLFKTMGIIIKFAPLGVLGAIAFTVTFGASLRASTRRSSRARSWHLRRRSRCRC